MPEPRGWPGRFKAVAALTLSSALLIVLLLVVFKLWGARLGGAELDPAASAQANDYRPAWQQQRASGQAHQLQEGLLATALALYALCLAFLLLRRRPRARLMLPLALLGWWLGVETLAAPHLVGPLNLWQYGFIRDVDHRPTQTSGQFNEDALRATPPRSAFRPEGLDLIFLGDSFAFGVLLPANRAFPFLVKGLLEQRFPDQDVEVANFAWVSSCTFLNYRRLVDLGEHYAPDVVVQCVDMTDFFDDIVSANALDRRGLYAYYDVLPITLRVWQALASDSYVRFLSWTVGGMPHERFFHSNQPLELSRPFMQPLFANLQRTRDWARAHGADYIAFVLPRSYQYSDRECPRNWEKEWYTPLGPYALEPFRWVDEVRPSADFPLVSLLPTFQQNQEFPTCMEDDPHWNKTGHRVAAEAIARELVPLLERRLGR